MEGRYVIDSVALINYFNHYFDEKDMLSREIRKKIDTCFFKMGNSIKLVIPSIVFIEIFRKFLVSEEKVKKFYYEIYKPIVENDNIEVKPLESEVLEIFQNLNDFQMELHDKIIFASAIQLNSILITKDPIIIKYNNKRRLVSDIVF